MSFRKCVKALTCCAFMLAACNSPALQTPISSSPSPSSVPTFENDPPLINATIPPPTETIISPKNPTWKTVETCLSPESYSENNKNLTGTIILKDFQNSYLLNLQTSELTLFPTSTGATVGIWGSDFAISPNHEWAAYIESDVEDTATKSRKLRLINAETQRDMLLNWTIDWQAIIGWLDDQHIVLWGPNKDDGTILVLNPFSSEWQEIAPRFPIDEDNEYIISSWYIYGQPISYYNPNFSKVIYPSSKEHIILWDVKNQIEIWRGTTAEYTSSTNAIWDSSGERAFVVTSKDGKEEIEILELNGDKVKNISLQLGININVEEFSLSPDNKHLAIWASPDNLGFEKEDLFLVNLQDKAIKSFCVHNGGYNYQPVWSPDGNWLLVNIDDNGDSYLALIDINQYKLFRLNFRNMDPYGWLKNTE